MKKIATRSFVHYGTEDYIEEKKKDRLEEGEIIFTPTKKKKETPKPSRKTSKEGSQRPLPTL
jgi:uncharacterized protein YlaI|tara:strand:+ start:3087 stop:3272 length:186 start_codon:yes stop_codon:yes gene_type:complete